MAAEALLEGSEQVVPKEIDALPYCDTAHEDDGAMASAQALIKQEMQQMQKDPSDYMRKTQKHSVDTDAAQRKRSQLTTSELERVHAGTQLPSIDEQRLKLERPEEQSNSVEWQSAIDNAKAQLQHQALRTINLHLLDSYGEQAWQSHNKQLQAELRHQQKRKRSLENQLQQLHKSRRVSQERASSELSSLEHKVYSLVRKNQQIAAACHALETQQAVAAHDR